MARSESFNRQIKSYKVQANKDGSLSLQNKYLELEGADNFSKTYQSNNLHS